MTTSSFLHRIALILDGQSVSIYDHKNMYRGFSCVDDFPRAICLPVDAPTRCSAPRGEIELGEAAYDGVILAVTPDGTCEKGADALRAFGCTEQGFRDRKSVVSAI